MILQSLGRLQTFLNILAKFLNMVFPGGSDGKESAWNTGDLGSVPGLGRSTGRGHGNPLQYSCLENPHGQRSLTGYSPWDHKELDASERLSTAHPHEILIVQIKTVFVYVLSVCTSIYKKYICTPLWNEKIFAPLGLIPLSPLRWECMLFQYKYIPIVRHILMHRDLWQKPLQYCKVISLHLVKINEKKYFEMSIIIPLRRMQDGKIWEANFPFI